MSNAQLNSPSPVPKRCKIDKRKVWGYFEQAFACKKKEKARKKISLKSVCSKVLHVIYHTKYTFFKK